MAQNFARNTIETTENFFKNTVPQNSLAFDTGGVPVNGTNFFAINGQNGGGRSRRFFSFNSTLKNEEDELTEDVEEEVEKVDDDD